MSPLLGKRGGGLGARAREVRTSVPYLPVEPAWTGPLHCTMNADARVRARWRANDFIARLGPLAFRPGQEVRRFLEATPERLALKLKGRQCVCSVFSHCGVRFISLWLCGRSLGGSPRIRVPLKNTPNWIHRVVPLSMTPCLA